MKGSCLEMNTTAFQLQNLILSMKRGGGNVLDLGQDGFPPLMNDELQQHLFMC